MSNQTRIVSRIRGREASAEIRSLLGDDFKNRDFMLAFVEQMRTEAGLDEPAPPPQVIPIARLAHEIIPFGAHKGHTFDETPLQYLDWLCREQESFYKNLRAYLKHPDLESRRGAEIGEPA